jgi:hypothetical protein
MKIPHPRFTVRRLMVAVAIVALPIGLWGRSMAFARIAREHAAREKDFADARASSYHWNLAVKYERAAMYPWLPVAPDPPEPQ